MEQKSELTKPNSSRAINYAKQLRQARRKEIRQNTLFTKASNPVKTADPYYKNRTGVKHVGYGAYQTFYGSAE